MLFRSRQHSSKYLNAMAGTFHNCTHAIASSNYARGQPSVPISGKRCNRVRIDMKKVTAKDVAARAGVSVSAVSRAYRGNAPIAEEKRKAIFAAATALGYVSKVDQVLAKQSSNTISMVVSEMRNPFYPIVMDELTRMLPGRGLKAIMHVVPAAEDVDTMIRQVIDFRTQGVILASSTITSGLARACRQNGIPAVLLNRVQTDSTMMAVCCDNYGGARTIARRFLDGGRQRIAFIGGRRDTSTHLERMRGFRDQLEEAGREIAVQFDGGFSYRQAYAAAQEMLSSVRCRTPCSAPMTSWRLPCLMLHETKASRSPVIWLSSGSTTFRWRRGNPTG